MKKLLIASAVASAFALPAFAQTAEAPAAPVDAPAAEAAPAPALTANVGVFSSYRFRGIAQTYNQPALQGGVDYAHESGFYVGNWNSNVSSGAGYPDGNLEMDFYGGYRKAFGDFGIDGGVYTYYYPGSSGRVLGTGAHSGAVNNKELYIAGSWKFISLKYSYAFDDYFSMRGVDANGNSTGASTRGSGYLDLSANYDLGEGWGVNAHVGHLDLKNVANGSYTDWKIGITKDLGGAWIAGLSWIDTNAHGQCSGASSYQPYCMSSSLSDVNGSAQQNTSKTINGGKGIAVVSVSRTF